MSRTSDPVEAQIMISSWGKNSDHPRCQFTFDVTHWRDPIGQKSMRHLNGQHSMVRTFVKADPRYDTVRDMARIHVRDLIGSGRASYVSIGFRDYQGTHIAPAIAEEIADVMSDLGYKVQVVHYGLNSSRK